MSKKQFAVLASGSGTNLQAILDAVDSGDIAASPCLVLTDRPAVRAIDRAEAASVATAVLPFGDFPDRPAFTDAVVETLREHGADFVCLAGFMRILSPSATAAYPNAIMNTHPALLPAFPGVDAVEQALEFGVKVTGCTVHFVDEEVDHGPIIIQEAVEVLAGDDADSLHARIKAVEHMIFPRAIALFAAGRLRVEGRHVAVID